MLLADNIDGILADKDINSLQVSVQKNYYFMSFLAITYSVYLVAV